MDKLEYSSLFCGNCNKGLENGQGYSTLFLGGKQVPVFQVIAYISGLSTEELQNISRPSSLLNNADFDTGDPAPTESSEGILSLCPSCVPLVEENYKTQNLFESAIQSSSLVEQLKIIRSQRRGSGLSKPVDIEELAYVIETNSCSNVSPSVINNTEDFLCEENEGPEGDSLFDDFNFDDDNGAVCEEYIEEKEIKLCEPEPVVELPVAEIFKNESGFTGQLSIPCSTIFKEVVIKLQRLSPKDLSEKYGIISEGFPKTNSRFLRDPSRRRRKHINRKRDLDLDCGEKQRKRKANNPGRGRGPSKCGFCGKTFQSHHYYKNTHLPIHMAKVPCELCSKLLPPQPSLIQQHMALSHPSHPRPTFDCPEPQCEISYAQKTNLNEHQRTCHPKNDTKIPCEICGKMIANKTRLKIHLQCHGEERPFKCPEPECGSAFKTRGTLAAHRDVHKEITERGGENLSKCDICNKFFRHSYSMKRHRAIHFKKSAPRPMFACDKCPKKYTFKPSLVEHAKIHTEGFVWPTCHICQRTFESDRVLKGHVKTHSQDNKMFCCHICAHTVRTPAELRTHLYSHSTERQFVCSTCGSTFKFPQHLKNHEKKHHKE